MAPDALIAVAVVAVIAIGLIAKLAPRRLPDSKVFACGRCGTASRHTDRTIEAWRKGKTKFFCAACHSTWLQSRPPQERSQSTGGTRSRSSGGSGCLGVVAAVSLVPLASLVAWAYA